MAPTLALADDACQITGRVNEAGNCPDEHELAQLARGTISEERGAALRDHLGDCATCMAAVAGLASIPPEDEPPETGTSVADVARYELVRLVATGGMGEVFLARDKVLGRDVAIKLLHEDTSSADSLARSRRRVLREAHALARLTHPNVVAVYDQGVLDGRAFLAMEYVRGRTLRHWIAEEAPDLSRVAEVLVQAGRGLLAAHEIGIVHRDFKPDNVLVGDDGRARVTDFGLARPATSGEPPDAESPEPLGDSSVTVDGATARPAPGRRGPHLTVSGTPAYMAPEQLAGRLAGPPSDQYAFCVTLREAIYGTRPPLDANARVRRDRRLQKVDAVLARGLSKEPADRFASMRDLLAHLEAAIAAPPRMRERRGALLLGALVAVVSAAGAWSVARHGSSAAARPQRTEGLHTPCRASGDCAPPLVCRFTEGNSCGASGAPGACGWPDDGCGAKAPEVCGCDGVSYKNQCEAHGSGVSVAHRGACTACTIAAACADVTVVGKRTPAFCRVPEPRSDSGAPPAGICWPRPSACAQAPSEPVCGLDGRTYDSACDARRSGVDVDRGAPVGSCPAEARDEAPPAGGRVGASIAPGGLAFGAPDEQGMDARPLMDLSEWIRREKLPIFSLLVSRNGVLVYELYTSSITRDHAHYLMGATSALTSALMGIAIDRRIVSAPETPVADALPANVFPSLEVRERFRGVTIRDVLGMSALDAPVPPRDKTEQGRERGRRFLASPNRTRFALSQALVAEPGASFEFTDVTPQIATGILEYATKTSALEFAEKTLFGPMDFHNYEWMHQDASGIDNGAYGLRLRPIDMQKLGVLYLREGVWENARLLSADWVLRSFSPWIKSSEAVAEPNYGWYWWTIDFGGRAGRSWVAHVAQGWKGQRIAVFADQGIVVTMTGAIEPPEDEAAIFRRVVQEYVVQSIEGAGATRAHPDAALRGALGDLLERVRTAPSPLKRAPEARMVPSVEPKERHRPFRPD